MALICRLTADCVHLLTLGAIEPLDDAPAGWASAQMTPWSSGEAADDAQLHGELPQYRHQLRSATAWPTFSPMHKPVDKKIPHTFLLRPETLAQIRLAAVEDVRSMNATVEVACRRWLAERAPPQKTA